MKKIVVLMLLAAIVCMPCAAFAQDSQTSEFERFLAEHNLTIPQVFADESGAEDFYYWVMDILREDPYHIFAFGHYNYQIFSEQIQQAYLAENGLNSEFSTYSIIDQRSRLIDSTYYAEGKTTYNCYSYAINQTDQWLIVGAPSGKKFDNTTSLEESTEMVSKDLNTFGYECVVTSTDISIIDNIQSYQNVIALRLAVVGGTNLDFHFMKLDNRNESIWRHKPSKASILTYNYVPTNNREWTNEAIMKYSLNYVYSTASLWYNSDIMFLVYAQNHVYSIVATGNNYHGRGTDQLKHFYEYKRTCNVCGYSETYWRAEICKGPCPLQRVVEYV